MSGGCPRVGNFSDQNWGISVIAVTTGGRAGRARLRLKAMTNAMHKAGLVKTQWTDGPTDGQGAMVAAWTCQQELQAGHATRLEDLDLMQEVRAYNQTDCKAMQEVLQHLRRHH